MPSRTAVLLRWGRICSWAFRTASISGGLDDLGQLFACHAFVECVFGGFAGGAVLPPDFAGFAVGDEEAVLECGAADDQ